ncbi:uncharacterized protein THITE_2124181 [Thermothielavioides terrestris NRRL 8126]|uniref:Uncharacterized protein n=1 Tax=Thermothielavioides terrestris (strain ATCC 38088 / NRRL 8126) TaxID=578455 RepID=G2RID5_THETT|nr:uncharacterized protein THITE_2124181 [Thermothielavioides terrestris NRRL 8126]AEO71597.1 hypothetical protein THITE_2124181 [Thermothielavioides terrestris NRRL 8126]
MKHSLSMPCHPTSVVGGRVLLAGSSGHSANHMLTEDHPFGGGVTPVAPGTPTSVRRYP